MLVHSILCMFTPLPSVSQHALASSTHKGRGFLLRSGCSLNHFGDFLLQWAAKLHSLSTGENGLPGSFDVCWRGRKSLRCAIEGSRIELCAVEGSLVSNNMCAGGKGRELHVHWREKRMDRCVLEGKSGQTEGRPLQRTSKTGNWTSLPGSTHLLMRFPSSTHLFGEFQLWIARMDDYKTFPAFLLNRTVEIADCFKLFYRFLNDTVLLANS